MTPCDPSSDGLADVLEARSKDIARRWEEQVRRKLSAAHLPEEEILNSLPEFLVAVIKALRAAPALGRIPNSSVYTLAEAHGAQRFRLGLDISQVVQEYSLLRAVILEVLQESSCPLSHEALKLLLDALSEANAEALRRYTEEHARALRDSEERLSHVLASLPLICWSYDAHGVVLLSEGKGLERVGFKPGQLVGQSVFEIVRGNTAVLAAVERALRGETFLQEVEFRGVWFETSFQPEWGPDGQVKAVTGLSLDVSERQHAQQELRQSETRYRLATLATHDIVWDWNVGTGQVQWSENLQRLTGHALTRVNPAIGWWAEHIHPEDRQRVVNGIRAALEGDEVLWADEYRFQRGDGSYMVVSDRGYVLRDTRGEALRMVGALQDITERKRAEQETQRRAGFEQHLIGIVSHDLRNPINAISMAAMLMLRQGGLDKPHHRTLERILCSAERAARLLADLLDFTQARLQGALPVEPRPADLHELTRQVVEEVQLAHPERQLVLEQRGEGRGEWDPDRLAQIITNLVNNALAYGAEHCAVRVRTYGLPHEVRLSVHNMGEPIPPERMDQLFQPLKRGEGSAPRGKHSIGLGLFIVKHIVDAHGGHISVESTAEDGTTFTVSLPRHPPSEARPPVQAAESLLPPAEPSHP
jgi:PAS domain S-box-containing protein